MSRAQCLNVRLSIVDSEPAFSALGRDLGELDEVRRNAGGSLKIIRRLRPASGSDRVLLRGSKIPKEGRQGTSLPVVDNGQFCCYRFQGWTPRRISSNPEALHHAKQTLPSETPFRPPGGIRLSRLPG